MSILDIKKQGTLYIIATLVCILFAMIYEYFSHEVYSGFMIYAFLIPLIFGVVLNFGLYIFKIKKLPTKFENNIYNVSIATLTFGSIVQGVIQIYGTTNSKIYIYLIVGLLLCIISLISYISRKNS